MAQKRNLESAAIPHEAALAALGARLARERLRRNLTQESLAEEAGVSRATLRRLEAGHSTQLWNLVRILRALGHQGDVDALVPEPPVQPLDELERKKTIRRRASSSADEAKRAAPKPQTWRWGEDR